MADFLLELLSEEIPARMQEKACADLARLFAAELGKAGLAAGTIETYATPRRLALIARGLPLATEPVSEELKGPRADAPPQALAGFLGKTGLTRDQLVERRDAKGNAILFAVIEKPGRATAEVLAEAVPAIVRAFPWPKSMRWGADSASTASLRWVRPLTGIVALLDEMVVPFEVAGIVSGAATVGHRFVHPGAITIGSADDYAFKLRAAHVILDPAERRRIIWDGATAAAAARGLTVVPDAGLVAENAGLTEWPVPLLGAFDPAFLSVPREVIQLTMRTNQKYFALTDAAGALAPYFVCTANIDARDGGALIVAGNAKVLAARLSDARFFWEQDLKVPFENYRIKLVDYQEKLGTLIDKTNRMIDVSEWLATQNVLSVEGFEGGRLEVISLAKRAASLALLDLPTGMVGEFPELEGVIGGYYARHHGEDDRVSNAISTLYKPKSNSDIVPNETISIIQSLSFKIESRVAFYNGGIVPTGSKDPFGIRRTELGIIKLILDNKIRLSLIDLLSVPKFGAMVNDPEAILNSIMDRLKVQQKEAGVRHDLIDAVFALGNEDDLVRLLARVHALQAFVTTADGRDLLAGYKRAANILKKEAPNGIATPKTLSYTPEKAESELIAALDVAEPAAEDAVAREDFAGAMTALSTLRSPIDAFFEGVTVNDPDPDKRAARLALLGRIRDAVHRVADFSRIEG